jgi:hypothetical protein
MSRDRTVRKLLCKKGSAMKIPSPLCMAAAAVIGFAPLSLVAGGVAQAGPLCPEYPNLAGNPRYEQLHQQCLQAERNQNLCTDARGCTPGDPCVVGSAYERAICGDSKLAGQ